MAGRQSLEGWLRDQRLTLYSDALRRESYLRSTKLVGNYEITPAGGRVEILPQDDVTIRMDLFAHSRVRKAWQKVVQAESEFDAWVEYSYSGAPDEDAPVEVTQPLDAALSGLRETCRRSLSTNRWQRLRHAG